MRRRSTADVGSLDMLLDTVCNTFGGICFIALLVSIISANLPKGEGEQSDTQIKVIEQDMRLEQLTRERDVLLEAVDIQKNTLSHASTDQAAYVASNTLKDLVQSKEEADEREAALKLQLSKLLSDNASLAAGSQQAQRELERLKALNDELKSKEEKAKQESITVVRLPMEHSTSRSPFAIFIIRNRIYPLRYTRSGGDDNVDHCIFTDLGSKRTRIRPRPGAGIQIPSDLARMPYLFELVQYMGSNYFLNIFVDSESFDSLCKIRNYMIAAGIPYNWDSYSDDMYFSPADSFSVQ